MILPQVLFISHSSRTRRLYHQALVKVDCEVSFAKDTAEALVHLIASGVDILVIDSSVPSFDIHMFLEVIEKHKDWRHISLVAIGFSEMRHLFPKHTQFAETKTVSVSFLKALCATV